MQYTTSQDRGMLIVRIALALVFIVHGWAKLTGLSGFVGFSGMIGIPAFFAYLVPFIEFFGGIALLLGYWSRLFAFLFAIIMFFAILLVKKDAGYLGGYEFEFILMLLSIAVLIGGPGELTLANARRKQDLPPPYIPPAPTVQSGHPAPIDAQPTSAPVTPPLSSESAPQQTNSESPKQ